MRIGPELVWAHLMKSGGTSTAAWLEANGHTYRRPGDAWHRLERECVRPGVDPHSHMSLGDLTPSALATRQRWVGMRDPVDWYPSLWAHCGREVGPLDRSGRVLVLGWDSWLLWALARSSVPHPTPHGVCALRESLLWWCWRRVLGGVEPTRILWTHDLGRDLPGIALLNVARLDPDTQRRALPVVTDAQRRCIQDADWWVRDLPGWGDRW